MGVSISQSNGSKVIASETPQGGAVTSLPNGDHVVSSETSNGNSNYQIHVQLYSPQGAPIGPAFSKTAPPVSLFTAPVVAGLADGAYEAVWVQQSNYASHLLAEHFTAQGTAAGQATLATASGLSVIGNSGYALAGLADGGFAAAWTVQNVLNSGSPAQVWAEAFPASGAPVGSATQLGTAASPNQALMIEAESNGHYVVSWNSPSGPEHQVVMDPDPISAPPSTYGLAPSGPAGADLSGAVSAAPSSSVEPPGLSALHPFASAAVALAEFDPHGGGPARPGGGLQLRVKRRVGSEPEVTSRKRVEM